MPDRAKPKAKHATSTDVTVQARTTRSRSKAPLTQKNKENRLECAPDAKVATACYPAGTKTRAGARAQPEALAASTGRTAQAAKKQSSSSQPKAPSKPARKDSNMKAVDKSTHRSLLATKTQHGPTDTTRSTGAMSRKQPNSTAQTSSRQQQPLAGTATSKGASKSAAESSAPLSLNAEIAALQQRLAAQKAEQQLLQDQAAAHQAAVPQKAAAATKEAVVEAEKAAAVNAKKAADLVALLHVKELQYTKVRAERDEARVAKAAAVQALAASRLANHTLVQRAKFLEQQLGFHDTETSAAAPASTEPPSMALMNDINPLFDNDMGPMIAQGANDDDNDHVLLLAGHQSTFSPSSVLNLSIPESASSGAPAVDVRTEDDSAACKASAHSLLVEEAAASELNTLTAIGSNVPSQAMVSGAAADAGPVVIGNGSISAGSSDGMSAPALYAAGGDHDISFASHTAACLENQPSLAAETEGHNVPTTVTRPDQAAVQGPLVVSHATAGLAGEAVQVCHDRQAGWADGDAGDDLVPYDKYLHQGSQGTWLPATASPDTMSPISMCSKFDFAMTLPEGMDDLHTAPVGGESPFIPSDFLDLRSPQSAVGNSRNADSNMEAASAARKPSAHTPSASQAAVAQFELSIADNSKTQPEADMPAAAAGADAIMISDGSVMSNSNRATPATLHPAVTDPHISTASKLNTGSDDQTVAAGENHGPIVSMTRPRPDCTGTSGTLMVSESTAALAVVPCQNGPTNHAAAGTASGRAQPSSTAHISTASKTAQALGKRRFSTANKRSATGGKRASAKGGLLRKSDWPAGKRHKPADDSPARIGVEELRQSSNITQGVSAAAHKQQGKATEQSQEPAQWNIAADGSAIFPKGVCKPPLSPLNPRRRARRPNQAANSLRAVAAALVTGKDADVQANVNARDIRTEPGQEAPHPSGPFAMAATAGLPSAPPAANPTHPTTSDAEKPDQALRQQHQQQTIVSPGQSDNPEPQQEGNRMTSRNDCAAAPLPVEQTQQHVDDKAEPVSAAVPPRPALPAAPADQLPPVMQQKSPVALQQSLEKMPTPEGGSMQSGGDVSGAGTMAPSLQDVAAGTTHNIKVGTQRRAGLKRLAIEGGVSGNLDMPAGKRHKLAAQPIVAGLQLKVGPFTMGAVKQAESPLEAHPKKKGRPRKGTGQKASFAAEDYQAAHAGAPSNFSKYIRSQQMQQLAAAEISADVAAITFLQQQQTSDTQPEQVPQQQPISGEARQDTVPEPEQEGADNSKQSQACHAELSQPTPQLQHMTQQSPEVTDVAPKSASEHTQAQQLLQQIQPMPKDNDDLTLDPKQQPSAEVAMPSGGAACKPPNSQMLLSPSHRKRHHHQQQQPICDAAATVTPCTKTGSSPLKQLQQQTHDPFAPYGLPVHTPMHLRSAKPHKPARLHPVTAMQQQLQVSFLADSQLLPSMTKP